MKKATEGMWCYFGFHGEERLAFRYGDLPICGRCYGVVE